MAAPPLPDFDITPSLAPPPGVVPNFENPESIRTIIDFTLGICIGVSSLFVLLRIWTRFFIVKMHGWEDYTMIIAWLMFIAYITLGFLAEQYGSGIHQWDVPLSHFFKFLYLANVLEVLYNPVIFTTKLSILLQYKRIFCPHNSGTTYWLIHVLIWSNLLYYIAVMIPQIVVCNPREKAWHPYLPGKCLDLPSILITGAVVNIISDFSILILPVHSIWKLQMSRSRKYGVTAIFATGLFACVSSIMRLYNNVIFKTTEDITYNLSGVALWTIAEITSGMICGCLPLLPNLFRHFVPKIKNSMTWGGSKGTNKTNRATKGNDSELSAIRMDNMERKYMQGEYIELDGRPQVLPRHMVGGPENV
ncbi:uncharacterized protein BP5553_00416 [Venustampulla echinocandica]|uniref:Rhodopsin domain-containing protein n=1 Tax=Venustampulla echinocandica TaxID=2656787 RepID=A0A370TY35_9HELO|nr:uncharacterized protein BP5553_00416 [Venustampulla echinocandica]RDL40437.1 hypothetical protein BP5553_00416 [Venustampulla echinocandica]